MMPMVVTVRRERAAVPARNFPFMTESLYIGWERRTERLPLVLSLFIASKPRDSPIIGPKTVSYTHLTLPTTPYV